MPERITVDMPSGGRLCRRVSYTYDATGYVLQKVLKKGGTVVKRIDYVDGIQYFDGVLATIVTSEGRVTPYNGAYEYEYFLKDHLGNTRVTFGEVHRTDVYTGNNGDAVEF